VRHTARPARPAARDFRDWLLAEAAAFRERWPELVGG